MQGGQKLNEIFLEKYLKKILDFWAEYIEMFSFQLLCTMCSTAVLRKNILRIHIYVLYTYEVSTVLSCTLRFKNVHFLCVCAVHGLYYCFTDVIAVRANIIHDENIVSMTNFVFKHYFLCKLPEDKL